MKRNYFVVDGAQYYTGTVFLVSNNCEEVEASFVCYDTEYKNYFYKIKACTYVVHEDIFRRRFIAVTDKRDERVRCPVVKQRSDSEIDGLFVGWIWYIVLMAISTIFYDRIGLWILISVIFFTWRAKKIKEEGTYIEW